MFRTGIVAETFCPEFDHERALSICLYPHMVAAFATGQVVGRVVHRAQGIATGSLTLAAFVRRPVQYSLIYVWWTDVVLGDFHIPLLPVVMRRQGVQCWVPVYPADSTRCVAATCTALLVVARPRRSLNQRRG